MASPSGRTVRFSETKSLLAGGAGDGDGDGFGDPAVSRSSCDGAAPAGYVVDYTDCNDAVGSAHPGAAEVGNGIDDDCDGLVDESASAEDGDAERQPGFSVRRSPRAE